MSIETVTVLTGGEGRLLRFMRRSARDVDGCDNPVARFLAGNPDRVQAMLTDMFEAGWIRGFTQSGDGFVVTLAREID